MVNSLYEVTVKTVVEHYYSHFSQLVTKLDPLESDFHLTSEMKFDVLWGLFTFNTGKVRPQLLTCDAVRKEEEVEILTELASVFSNLKLFVAMLDSGQRRVQLYQVCHAIINCDQVNRRVRLLVNISLQLQTQLQTAQHPGGRLDPSTRKTFRDAQRMAGFFGDSGWYVHAIDVLRCFEDALKRVKEKCFEPEDVSFLNVAVDECQLQLLRVLVDDCKFSQADAIHRRYQPWSSVAKPPAHYYLEMSRYCFAKSEYDSAYNWSMKAVICLHDALSPTIVVDVLRVASKACVVKRHFEKAELLIHEAVLLAKETYGEFHPKYADCLSDFGFFLLNVDGASSSFTFYRSATAIRENIFGDLNLMTAMGREDTAYATYVYEYNTGKFDEAMACAERSLETMCKLLKPDHLLMASAKRVLALILEEIAVDSSDKPVARANLERAKQLHLSALALATQAFGEKNIQTAKHYGNLGRLYQSMELPDEAEKMHLKAICIKEQLVGPDDYEVALSVGHLASLYNYDKLEYDKAEALYLRSVSIGSKLFGPGYSGLEYDYRGLIRVYQVKEDMDKVFKYRTMLNEWKQIRSMLDAQDRPGHLLKDLRISQSLNSIVDAVIFDGREPAQADLKGEKLTM